MSLKQAVHIREADMCRVGQLTQGQPGSDVSGDGLNELVDNLILSITGRLLAVGLYPDKHNAHGNIWHLHR